MDFSQFEYQPQNGVAVDWEGGLQVTPHPDKPEAKYFSLCLGNWQAELVGNTVRLIGTRPNGEKRKLLLPADTPLYEGTSDRGERIGVLGNLPRRREELLRDTRPSKSPWHEYKEEQIASAREYRPLSNELGMAFREAQQEAYESWCAWEAQLHDEDDE